MTEAAEALLRWEQKEPQLNWTTRLPPVRTLVHLLPTLPLQKKFSDGLTGAAIARLADTAPLPSRVAPIGCRPS